MTPFATVYIDEAGDPGVKDGLSHLGGLYEIFVLGALVLRTENEPASVEWIKEIRERVRARQRPALHYRDLAPRNRLAAATMLAQQPCRAFALISHKSNLRSYFNPRLRAAISAEYYYNFCCRLLLERVTAWCAAFSRRTHGEVRPLRLVFSERGGHNYDALIGYLDILEAQARARTTLLAAKEIVPGMLPREEISAVRHDQLAGLQLADIVASAYYQAVQTRAANWSTAPAMALRPVTAKGSDGIRANVGLTIWPLAHQGDLPADIRPLFASYGYR